MTLEPAADLFERIRFRGTPTANPDSVVRSGHARFSVLTSRLIRLEWSETGAFEDRGTYAFPTRYAPAPPYTVRTETNRLTITTENLTLSYDCGSGKFAADNLALTFALDGKPYTWTPGTPNPFNLRGTRRTLDQCMGDAALDEGLLSRDGWVLFDDSRSVLFEEGWVAPRPDHEIQDWYFFGYGRDYKATLAEYTHFGGPIPLIPRFVLGAWWSRYWAYSTQDLMDLVHHFEAHDLPLDVLVLDMDWHTPHGWTGYTWNRELFPDPPAFLQWVHDKGLRVTLNLHPAEGVQPFEEIYPRFAQAMGLSLAGGPLECNPSVPGGALRSGTGIPFRIADKKFVRHYFELLHHPMEDEGVDFWWMDWQQGESSEVKGLDPLLWLNHLHFQDSTRRGRRPMLYSRWGGLGNHRYPIGFSGDTVVVWSALQFQPYFTATAANVAFGWWSHDIGGHMGGATEPELYARWVQFGALSPCLRLHATKDPRAERRPWKYPDEIYQAAKAAFHWRYRLIPYIYTMARIAHDTSISLCRPLYYEYPETEAAYVARFQYFFGDQMIAAPIVHPADPATGMATTDVWIPEGTWIDYTTKETFQGPRWVRLVGDLRRLPMLMKAGAILPLAAPFDHLPAPHLASGTTAAIPQDRLVLAVFPGDEGHFRLYEDDGTTENYQQGQYEWTAITTQTNGSSWTVQVAPVEGHCDALPARRQLEIRLEGSHRPKKVLLDGIESLDWSYDPAKLCSTIQLPLRDKRQPTTVTAVAEGDISALGEAHNRRVILADVRRLLGHSFPEHADPLLDAVLQLDAPGRLDAVARLGGPFTRIIEYDTPEEASQQLGRVIVAAPAGIDEPYDVEVTFTLWRSGQPEQHSLQIQGTTEAQVIATPFAFTGQVQTMYWEAQVEITWRGSALTCTYRSRPLFPTVSAWRATVYDHEAEPVLPEQLLDEHEFTADTLNWVDYFQHAAELRNLSQPHVVFLPRAYQQRLKAGESLAVLLSTTIVSPVEQAARILFPAAGPAELYLNGEKVGQASVTDMSALKAFANYPFLHRMHQTQAIRLDAGKNTLLVDSRPDPAGRLSWYFGCVLVTPEGELLTDLHFE